MKSKVFFSIMLLLVTCAFSAPKFQATFESGMIIPDIGQQLVDTRNGGGVTVVENPDPSGRNTSSRVLKVRSPFGSTRSEYQTSPERRLDTVGKSYIYTWKVYYPSDFLDGVGVNWMLVSQWKTYPCEYGDDTYRPCICDIGYGIFNQITLTKSTSSVSFDFRAEPDCHQTITSYDRGEWTTYILEMYWTTETDGYYRVFKNGTLLDEQYNQRTLFENFVEGTCDIYWALGMYSSLSDAGGNEAVCYIDDMAVYDMDDGYSVENCEIVETSVEKDHLVPNTNKLYPAYPNPFNPATRIQYDLHESGYVSLNVYNINGQKIDTLVNGFQTKGQHEIVWQPKGLSSGTYFCRLQAGEYAENIKLVLSQ